MPLPLNVARYSLGHGRWIQQLLPPFRLHLDLLHTHLLPSLLRAMCHLGTSWRNCSAWILALIHSLQSCIRWTFVSVVLHGGRWLWVVLLLRLFLHLLLWVLILRMRMMMMKMMLLMMMMEMLASPMTCLLDILTLYHSWQKGGVVLAMGVVILKGRVSIGHFC